MTIQRDRGELTAVCNGCGCEHPGGIQEDFKGFIKEIRDGGWIIRKEEDSGDWEHYCEDCAMTI